jgi:hypothetical protein
MLHESKIVELALHAAANNVGLADVQGLESLSPLTSEDVNAGL